MVYVILTGVFAFTFFGVIYACVYSKSNVLPNEYNQFRVGKMRVIATAKIRTVATTRISLIQTRYWIYYDPIMYTIL